MDGSGSGRDNNIQKMNFSRGVKMYTLNVTSTWRILDWSHLVKGVNEPEEEAILFLCDLVVCRPRKGGRVALVSSSAVAVEAGGGGRTRKGEKDGDGLGWNGLKMKELSQDVRKFVSVLIRAMGKRTVECSSSWKGKKHKTVDRSLAYP